IVLAEKRVDQETIVIDLDDRPAWIYEKNPLGRVPVIEEDTFVLSESAVINEYLEERYPEPALLPADPGARAFARMLIFRFDELFLGDVRGPNAHSRGHIPGSKPLVLGSPPPMSDPAVLQALAPEVGLRLRRHGVTGDERLVLYDRGDGVGAMPAAQMAELAGHPRVAVLLGGLAAWPQELEVGAVALEPVKTSFDPRLEAVPTREELASRLDDPRLVILDVRTPEELPGKGWYHCGPRQ